VARLRLCISLALPLALLSSIHGEDRKVTIQVKSFIGRMVSDASERSGRPDEATSKALGFEDMVGGRVQAYELMLATDQAFRENPKSGSQDTGQFRLWSQVTFSGSCRAGKLTSWRVEQPAIAFGKEGPLQASGELLKPLSASPAPTGSTPQSSVTFLYAVKGRPHALAVPAFENIRPRGCYWIWHEIGATASCTGDTLSIKADLLGSGFPSHRIWVDGELKKEILQGPFDSLWKCSATPSLVR
jgi:hypothetical protein